MSVTKISVETETSFDRPLTIEELAIPDEWRCWTSCHQPEINAAIATTVMKMILAEIDAAFAYSSAVDNQVEYPADQTCNDIWKLRNRLRAAVEGGSDNGE